MTYTPTDGDHVTVTRTRPDGRTSTWTGVLSHCDTGGFTLTGVGPDGRVGPYALASADVLFRCYGVVQDVQPTNRP